MTPPLILGNTLHFPPFLELVYLIKLKLKTCEVDRHGTILSDYSKYQTFSASLSFINSFGQTSVAMFTQLTLIMTRANVTPLFMTSLVHLTCLSYANKRSELGPLLL